MRAAPASGVAPGAGWLALVEPEQGAVALAVPVQGLLSSVEALAEPVQGAASAALAVPVQGVLHLLASSADFSTAGVTAAALVRALVEPEHCADTEPVATKRAKARNKNTFFMVKGDFWFVKFER